MRALLLLVCLSTAAMAQPVPHPEHWEGWSHYLPPAAAATAALQARQLQESVSRLHSMISERTPLPGLFDRELLKNVYDFGVLAGQTQAVLESPFVPLSRMRQLLPVLDGAASRVNSGIHRHHTVGPVRAHWEATSALLRQLESTVRGSTCWWR